MSKISSQKMKRLLTALLIAIGCFLIANHFYLEPKRKKAEQARLREEAEAQQQEGEGEDVTAIKVIDVIRHDYVDILDALGNIKGGMEIKLTFSIPGTIKSINYKAGEKYDKGSLLMSLNDEDIVLRKRRVEAQMNKAQTAVTIAKQKLEEHEKLFTIGAIPKTTLEKVRLEVESSQYDLEGARLEVKANEAVLEKSNMYAISDGMIGELYIEEGETITANTLIGTHILTEYVKPEFGVIERDMNKIKEGQTSRVMVDAYPGQVFTGVVDSVSPVVGGMSRTATVSVKVDNEEGLLLPGMFARVQVDLFKKKNALVIPTEAVLKEEEAAFVFVLDPEAGTVKKTEIKIGYERTDYTQVDEGVEEGQTIATTSISNLKDEGKVEVIEKQTLEF